MDDLDLLKQLPGRVDPPDDAAKQRMRALLESQSRTTSSPARRHRRVAKVGVLGIAAVLAAGSLAAAIAVHPWTASVPVALQGISDPTGAVTSQADLAAVVAEFAPTIRLPEGRSFDVWVQRMESLPEAPDPAGGPASSMIGSGLTRGLVASNMMFIAQCQWGQRWLDSSSVGDRAGTAQAIRVMQDVDGWFRSSSPEAGSWGSSDVLDGMRNNDRVEVQSLENNCGYTGSWGTTPAEQDTTTTGRLRSAAEIAQRYLREGGDADAFGYAAARDLAPEIDWTTPHMQPAPASPGAVFIGPSPGAGVTLVAVSESGTQFCAVVTDTAVQRGTTTNDLSTVEDADGTVNAQHPGPITCAPGNW